MKKKFKKIKTEHTILPEFHWFLLDIEKKSEIARIIPWRISRQQKGSSEMRFSVSYFTSTGIKCIMSKWSTAQELFVVCKEEHKSDLRDWLQQKWEEFYRLNR